MHSPPLTREQRPLSISAITPESHSASGTLIAHICPNQLSTGYPQVIHRLSTGHCVLCTHLRFFNNYGRVTSHFRAFLSVSELHELTHNSSYYYDCINIWGLWEVPLVLFLEALY